MSWAGAGIRGGAVGLSLMALAAPGSAQEVEAEKVEVRPDLPGLAGVDPDIELSERRKRVLDSKGTPSLPGLTHRDNAFLFEYTFAFAEPTAVGSAAPLNDETAVAYSARWLLEAPFVDRVWFFGVTSDVAAASVPSGQDPLSGGSALILGNPELWARGMWTSEAGLSAGGGLGVVVPVPRRFSPLEATVVRAIRVVRPWDFPHFDDMVITARPWFDIRHVTGPVTLQIRQGLDLSVVARDLRDNENRYDLTAILIGYVGLRPFEPVTFGIEAAEVYQITADTAAEGCAEPCDGLRAQFTLSPSLRVHLPVITPSLAVLLPLSTPLRGEVTSYVAGRLFLEAVF